MPGPVDICGGLLGNASPAVQWRRTRSFEGDSPGTLFSSSLEGPSRPFTPARGCCNPAEDDDWLGLSAVVEAKRGRRHSTSSFRTQLTRGRRDGLPSTPHHTAGVLDGSPVASALGQKQLGGSRRHEGLHRLSRLSRMAEGLHGLPGVSHLQGGAPKLLGSAGPQDRKVLPRARSHGVSRGLGVSSVPGSALSSSSSLHRTWQSVLPDVSKTVLQQYRKSIRDGRGNVSRPARFLLPDPSRVAAASIGGAPALGLMKTALVYGPRVVAPDLSRAAAQAENAAAAAALSVSCLPLQRKRSDSLYPAKMLSARTLGGRTLAAMRFRARALGHHEDAKRSLAAQELPALAGAAAVSAVALVGYLTASFMCIMAHHVVKGISKVLEPPPPAHLLGLEAAEEGQDGTRVGERERPRGEGSGESVPGSAGLQWDGGEREEEGEGGSEAEKKSSWWPNGAFAAAVSTTSDLFRRSRSTSLVSSSTKGRRSGKRVPLMVSAAAPSAVFEQAGAEGDGWPALSPPPLERREVSLELSAGVRRGGSKRLPLMVSAAAPSAVFEQAGTDSDDWTKFSPPPLELGPAARRGGSKRVPLMVSAAAPNAVLQPAEAEGDGWTAAGPRAEAGRSEPLSVLFRLGSGIVGRGSGATVSPLRRSERVPLMVSAAAPNECYPAGEENSAEEGEKEGIVPPESSLSGHELRVRAVLDATWVPSYRSHAVADAHNGGAGAANGGGAMVATAERNGSVRGRKKEHGGKAGEEQGGESGEEHGGESGEEHGGESGEEHGGDAGEGRDGDSAVALAAALVAQQMEEMERSQQEQLQALRNAARTEAQLQEELHQKQIAALQAQLSAALQEASVAKAIAQQLLDADVSKSAGTLVNGVGSNGSLSPGAKSKEKAASLEHEEKMVTEMMESFNLEMEMKVSKERARAQALEDRLKEAETLQRRLANELQEAKTQTVVARSSSGGESLKTENSESGAGGTPSRQQSRDAVHPDKYVSELRSALSETKAVLFKQRLQLEEKGKLVEDLQKRLSAVEAERDSLRVDGFQKRTKELMSAQEVLAQQAKANLEITATLEKLLEEAPALQAELAEVRQQLAREREARRADVGGMQAAVVAAREEAAALRVELVRLEKHFTVEMAEVQRAHQEELASLSNGRWGS